MLHILGIVEVNGADLNVRMKGVLVEKNSASGVMGHEDSSSNRAEGAQLPLAEQFFSMAPSLPRRVPGFQFRMLRRVCSSKWLCTSLIKRYSGLGELCLRSWESR